MNPQIKLHGPKRPLRHQALFSCRRHFLFEYRGHPQPTNQRRRRLFAPGDTGIKAPQQIFLTHGIKPIDRLLRRDAPTNLPPRPLL